MNTVARSWYYSLLAGHYKNDGDFAFISDEFKRTLPDDAVVTYLVRDDDFAFVVETHTRVQICFRGTHGKRGWKSNLRFKCNSLGFGSGFYEGFLPFKDELLSLVSGRPEKVVDVCAHSRGCAFATYLTYHIKKELNHYVKPVLYCPPRPVNEKGLTTLGEVDFSACSVISYNDFIDNVGAAGLFGRHVGSCIMLPRTREKSFRERIKDLIPGWGHAYSEVTDGLTAYFNGRGMRDEVEYLKSVRHLADC